MPEITRLKRNKPLRGLTTQKETENKESYYYPKSNLYTRQEFELLDTIYSDEPYLEEKEEKIIKDNFWQGKEDYIRTPQPTNDFLTKLVWFVSGVMLTSVIWLIFFQVQIHEIRTKNDTQIVFQNSAGIMTDKTADKEIAKTFKLSFPKLSHLFKPKQQKVVIPQPVLPLPAVRFHIVENGDSLWTIANKYYSSPTPENIDKIMKANNMKRVGILGIGQKLTIP